MEGKMYVIFDSLTETLIGPFNDYESAQMWLLYASEDLPDGGANLTIESISEPMEWAQDNHLSMSVSA
jgi:hypothetical protein